MKNDSLRILDTELAIISTPGKLLEIGVTNCSSIAANSGPTITILSLNKLV